MVDICAEKCINEKKVKQTLESMPGQDDTVRIADIFKALSDPTRLKIVLCLLDQEHCVCDIAVICQQTDSAISHQLRILRAQKIVKNRREGKAMYYSLDDNHVASLIKTSLEHIRH